MTGPISEEVQASADPTVSQGQTETQPVVRMLGMIVAGALAAGLCYAVVTGVGDVYPTPEEALNLKGIPSPEEQTIIDAALRVAATGNAMAWLGITGAILGGMLALATGLLWHAGRGIAIGTVAGMIVGGGLGYLSGNFAISNHASLTMSVSDDVASLEQQTMLMHGITWSLIGLGVGLGCGLARPTIQPKPVLISVIVAGTMGCVAGGIFPIVAGVAAPLENSVVPIPGSGVGRMIWMGLASLLMAAGLGRVD